ncbi:hypothetical protein EPN52_06470 [bacterium]|nr:MAG: hypothetical protein EPN52_06470 [bacterium]
MLTALLLFATVVTSGSCPIDIQSVHTYGLVTTVTFLNRTNRPLYGLEIIASFGDGRKQFYQYIYRVPGAFTPRQSVRVATPPLFRAAGSYEAFEMDCSVGAPGVKRSK